MDAFRLSKWYLDCVADDGSALIGYWARLSWHALAMEYAALLVAPAGAEPKQFHTLRAPQPPILAGSECRWRCAPLHIDGQWTSQATPVQADLLDTPNGGIRWSIHQPRAQARIAFSRPVAGLQALSGLGYVEELELTIPPWRLPFDVLHWGRCLSPDHALVWMGWQERDSRHWRRFAVLDGTVDETFSITDDAVMLPGVNAELRLGARRPLREGHLVATVLGAVPGLTALLPEQFRRAYEAKWLSRAQLLLPGGAPDQGWAIHEVVTW